MSKRDRHDRGALVALGLLLGAVLSLALIEVGARQKFDRQVSQPNASKDNYAQDYHGPAEGYWWPEFAARDTYAQWAMTLVAILATGISIVGVLLIRRTFEETKRTADEATRANFLTEQGRRAWVSLSSIVIDSAVVVDANEIRMTARAVAKNHGATPAFGVFFDPYIVADNPIFPEQRDRFDGRNTVGIGFTLFPAAEQPIGPITFSIQRREVEVRVAALPFGDNPKMPLPLYILIRVYYGVTGDVAHRSPPKDTGMVYVCASNTDQRWWRVEGTHHLHFIKSDIPMAWAT